MKKIAINGFGRIGRLVARILLDKYADQVELVAINDLTDAKTLAHLFKYDSVHKIYNREISATADMLIVDGKGIKILAERNPEKLPWAELGVDLVIESTGMFRAKKEAMMHVTAGAKKVIISAPAKDTVDATIVLGVNTEELKAEHQVISNASCTTNCLAPVCKVLHDTFGIIDGIMTTVHSYTNDQKILDLPHSDLRRARSAAVSMIPTSTGAAKAIGLVIPELNGKLNGYAVRVPTPDGSLVDLTVTLDSEPTVEEINNAMKLAAEGPLKGVLSYNTDPIVSIDIVGNPYSSIFDSEFTKKQGKLYKILAWYDNEFGYSNRTADLAVHWLNM
ncbi:MAG: type I glyceraldehyde-3-phosphate dehydrogenase [Candidatus Zophobacter franzmannii]|nr:type I glyceraldehyde-3-phosphate dehydrogenase [Candidatus Zophobacter franzmannii]